MNIFIVEVTVIPDKWFVFHVLVSSAMFVIFLIVVSGQRHLISQAKYSAVAVIKHGITYPSCIPLPTVSGHTGINHLIQNLTP